jgi:hypothetical protein
VCLLERRLVLARGFAITLGACVAVGLWIAPKAFRMGGEHLASTFLESSVREWAPVTSEVLFGSFQGRVFLLLIFLSVMGAVRRPEDTPTLRAVSEGLLPPLLLAMFVLLGFTSLRMIALFALGAGPLWLPLAARALARLAALRRQESVLPLAQGAALVGLLGLSSVLYLDRQVFQVGAGLMHERVPERAVQEMRARSSIKRLYNAYNFGGFLIWERYPEAGVFVDGRAITVYPAPFLEAFDRAYQDPQLFEALAQKYAVDGVLLPTNSPRTQQLLAYLRQHPRFQATYTDEIASVFELRSP